MPIVFKPGERTGTTAFTPVIPPLPSLSPFQTWVRHNRFQLWLAGFSIFMAVILLASLYKLVSPTSGSPNGVTASQVEMVYGPAICGRTTENQLFPNGNSWLRVPAGTRYMRYPNAIFFIDNTGHVGGSCTLH